MITAVPCDYSASCFFSSAGSAAAGFLAAVLVFFAAGFLAAGFFSALSSSPSSAFSAVFLAAVLVFLAVLVPLVFFALGIAAAEGMRYRFQQGTRIHWRQLILLEEIVTLFAVGLMPASLNMLANATVSFSCAMQVQAFRKVNGYAFASTMCIGNLRSGMDSLCAFFRTRNREPLRKAGHYFAIILFFALGAGLGGWGITQFGMGTIWLSCALLVVGFLLMFLKEDVEEIEEEIEALEQRK